MSIGNNGRRRFLQLAGATGLAGVAGCTGGDEDTSGAGQETGSPEPADAGGVETDDEGEEADHEEELPEGVSEEEFERGPVPPEYRTALSQADEERVVANLVSKEAVKFQEAEEAVDAGLTTEGRDCGNCAEYIPDMNGDGFGACAKVEGYVDPEDWCALWESIEEAREEGEAGEDDAEEDEAGEDEEGAEDDE